MNYELRPLSEISSLDVDPDRARLLLGSDNELISQLDFEELLTSIFERIKEVFKQTIAATLSIHDPKTNELRVHLLHSGDPDLFREGMPLPLEGTPSGVAFSSRKVVLIKKLVVADFPTPLIERAYADGIRSGCSVPLISNNRVVGAITIGAAQENGYSEEDAALLVRACQQVAMPIENAVNFRIAKRESERSQLLHEIGQAIVASLSLNELFKTISDCLRRFINHDTATVILVDPKTNQLRVHLLDQAPAVVQNQGNVIPWEGTPSGLCISTRQTILRDKIDFEEFFAPEVREVYAAGIRSGCSVPLITHDQVLGTLNVWSRREAAFTAEDAELLEQIAGPVAIAVENALNFQRAERESERNQLLHEVGQAIVSSLSLTELFRTIAGCLRRFINHDMASVVLVDPVTGQMRVHLLDRPPIDIWGEGTIIPAEGTPAGLCIKTGKTILRHTVDFDEFFAPEMRMAYAAGLRCGCGVPLISHDQVLGSINVGSFHEHAFTEEDAELLEQIAGPVAIAVENALNFQRAERERDRFQLMLNINNAVVSHLDLKQLVKTISASLRDIVPHDSAGIALYEPEFNHLREYTNVEYKDLAGMKIGETIPLEGTPAGEVFLTGKPMLIKRPDRERYPTDRYSQNPVEATPKSACLVLLTTHGKKLGIAGVSSTQENSFTEKDLELFEHVSDQIAIAVQNSLNYELANRERVRAQTLLQINNAITSTLDLHKLIRATSDCLRDYFQHDFAGVALYDDEIDQLRVHSFDLSQPDQYLIAGDVFPVEGTMTGLAFTSGQPIVRNRFNPNDSAWSMARKFYEEHGLRAMCFIPMIWGDRAVGVLNLGCRREDAFSESDIELLTHIAGQVAIAFQNSLNFQRATKATERTQTLLEASNAIATNLDLRELLRTTSTCLRRYFNHDVTGLALYDESTNSLLVHGIDRNDHSRFGGEGTRFPLAELSPLTEAFTSGKPVVNWRIDFEKYPGPPMKAVYDAGWRSGTCIPLVAHDQKLGVLGLASFHDDAFSRIDMDLLMNIAGQVALAVENILQYKQIESLKNKLASEKGYLEEEIRRQYNFAEIVGESNALRGVLKQVETVAPTDSTVLLCGETGTGKELIARAIHNLSARQERTLVKLNCAAIPTGLLESELFGHEKGAFTGAVAQRVGRFELAHQGTLLLDEIGEIPLDLQPKLLRVLQEHEFERLGSSRTIKTDARLIAATNCDLAQMVAAKTFRSDLYYRLNVFPVTIPPLRERTGDIPLLVGYFAQKHAARMNKHIKTIPVPTMQALCNYHWPGNVRELENFVERSVILSRGAELESPLAELQTTAVFAAASGSAGSSQATSIPKLSSMEDMERAHIEEVLRHANGMIAGKGGAAEILGLPSSTLRSRMKKLGIK